MSRIIYIAIQLSDNFNVKHIDYLDNRSSTFIDFRMRETNAELEEIGLVRHYDFTVNIKFWCERNLLYVTFFTDEAYALFLLNDIAKLWIEYDLYIRDVFPKRVRLEKLMHIS